MFVIVRPWGEEPWDVKKEKPINLVEWIPCSQACLLAPCTSPSNLQYQHGAPPAGHKIIIKIKDLAEDGNFTSFSWKQLPSRETGEWGLFIEENQCNALHNIFLLTNKNAVGAFKSGQIKFNMGRNTLTRTWKFMILIVLSNHIENSYPSTIKLEGVNVEKYMYLLITFAH